MRGGFPIDCAWSHGVTGFADNEAARDLELSDHDSFVVAQHTRRTAPHQLSRAEAGDDDELEHRHAGWTLHHILFSIANGFRGGPDDLLVGMDTP
jgi:hypothetical protein